MSADNLPARLRTHPINSDPLAVGLLEEAAKEIERLRARIRELEAEREWRPIAEVKDDETVILANFTAACWLTGAPHVWTATYVTQWENLNGEKVEGESMWCECSCASMNENGTPTHFMPLPAPPQEDKP